MSKEPTSLSRSLQHLRDRDPQAHQEFLSRMRSFIAGCIDEDSPQKTQRRPGQPRDVLSVSRRRQ